MYKTSLFIIIFFISSLINAEIIKDFKVNGNKRVSKETIRIYGDIELNKNYEASDLDRIIKNLYSTNFFEDIKIEISNNILNIELKEYPVINQLVIVGEKTKRYKEQIIKILKLKEKKSFVKSFLAKDIENIKKLYASIGYNAFES